MNRLIEKQIRILPETDLIVLTILFYLFRTTVPIFKFPFLALYTFILFYSLWNSKIKLNIILRGLMRNFYLSISVIFIFTISFILSKKLYLIIFKDIVNAIVLMSLFILIITYIRSKKDLLFFIDRLIYFTIVFSIIISALILNSSFGIFTANTGFSSGKEILYSLTTFLSSDYNFAILPILLGMIGIFYFLSRPRNLVKNGLLYLILIFFSTTIFFSGSRRGMIIISGIIIILIIVQILAFLIKKDALIATASSTKWFLVLIIVQLFLIVGAVFFLPVQMKRVALSIIGISARSYKQVVSTHFYRYSTLFSKYSYLDFQKVIWPVNPDSREPDSGWDIRIGTIAFPLTGEGVEMLPAGSKGYKMDKTCNANTWENNAYSYTDISSLFKGKKNLFEDEYFYASVYCFVSKDFDGTWAKLSVESDFPGKIISYYDLNQKGVWQKLSICFKNNGEISPVYLYWSKNGVNDFSTLKGNIIYAYPEYRIIKQDPKDPSTGWGTRISTTVYPLSGENVEIVPQGATGYLMDNRCNATTWEGNAYSYSIIGNRKVVKGDSLLASVYCFVSKDFDGTWVKISSEGSTYGNKSDEYDLGNTGIWQKLYLNVACNEGIAPVYLYFSKNGVTDFSKMKGYVIFAYPQYELIRNGQSISSFSNDNQAKIFEKSEGNLLIESIPQDSNDVSRLHFNANNNSKKSLFRYQDEDVNITLYPVKIKCTASGINPRILPFSLMLYSKFTDKERIRGLIPNLFTEDTTYYDLNKKLDVDTISKIFYNDRLLRWQFALQIFSKEYTWKQKLFGGGFNFLNWYGYYFLKDKNKTDWPHNPILSVLLYSGIIGLGFYIILLYKAIKYYLKYLKEYFIMYLFFLITFFFSFFSSGSPFDPPIMGFFILFPFFLHSIHSEDNNSLSNN